MHEDMFPKQLVCKGPVMIYDDDGDDHDDDDNRGLGTHGLHAYSLDNRG
mgnify:CR=1 FL=1